MVYKKSLALLAFQLHKQALGLVSLKVPAWPRADPPSPSRHFTRVRSEQQRWNGAECLGNANALGEGFPVPLLAICLFMSLEAETPIESLPEPEGDDKEEVEGGDQPTTPPEPRKTSSECLTLFLPGAPLSGFVGAGGSHVFGGRLM